MSRKRQMEQNEAMRARILATAREILAQEGPEALSIRRIAGAMDYSPGILYHYFENKDALLHALLLEGYGRILSSVGQDDGESLLPDRALRRMAEAYLWGVLEWPEEYRAVMLRSDPAILAVTSVLDGDACDKRPAMKRLAETVRAGMEAGLFAPGDPQLTAQALWCALFGLATRLIVEGIPPGPGRDALIDRTLNLIVKGICL